MNDVSNDTKKSSYVKWFFMDVIINNEKKSVEV